MHLRLRLTGVLAAASIAGCSSHAMPLAPARPTPPTANEALDTPPAVVAPRTLVCTKSAESGDPLVVDLRPEERGALELAMRDGIAVVAFDCNGLRVLEACTLRGSYGFTSFAPKEQVVRLESSEELRANLPFSGALLSAQIGGELARGVTLDVALVMLGRSRTTRVSARSADLRGACVGATHFVRGAFVGAFAMETGSRAEARTAVEILHAGVSGGGSSRKRVRQRDGSVEQCRGGGATKKTPRGCALLRLQLLQIDRAVAKNVPVVAAAGRSSPTPAPGPDDVACPFGLVESAGKCVASASSEAHPCSATDATGCERRCDGGDLDACLRVASALADTRDGAKGLRAQELYARACKSGRPEGCAGELLLLRRRRGATDDSLREAQLVEQACDGGSGDSCLELGDLLAQNNRSEQDLGRAARAYERGCDAGVARACTQLAGALMAGRGVPADAARALAALDRGCVGEDDAACALIEARKKH